MAWKRSTSASPSAGVASLTSTATGRSLTLQVAQRPTLAPGLVEIARRQPVLDRRANGGPLAVQDRVPGGVAVAALHHHVLVEDSLEAEAEPARRAPRGGVEGVAFPLQPPVAEIVHGIAHEQEKRLR